MKMIVGLGNPGSEYDGTRHNIGFDVVELLAESLGIKVKKRKFGARFGEVEFEDKKLILLKPQQYMNRSGQAVATATGFYKMPIPDMLVITDDMALETGRIRLRAKGSAGGHNGLKDIIEKLGTDSFARLRVGIGQPEYTQAYDYVLSKIPREQKEIMAEAVERAKNACLCWLRNGIESAMNEYNKTVNE
jgi:PTH1 family peptidyl-tRNA hydrolase